LSPSTFSLDEQHDVPGGELPLTSTPQVPLPTFGLSGFDASLDEGEKGIQSILHWFAKDVMRPLGREIEHAADQASLSVIPVRQYHIEMLKLGFGPDAMAGMPPDRAARLQSIIPGLPRSMLWQS
jgi:acyl-CoA dehydrogenase